MTQTTPFRPVVALGIAVALVLVHAPTSTAAGAQTAAPVGGPLTITPVDSLQTTATLATAGPTIAELDLVGIDRTAEAELERLDGTTADLVAGLAPDTAPGLEVADPIGVLPPAVIPGVLTEKISAAPFSVMGVTWDLTTGVHDVVVQYRTFRDGEWSDWGWAGAAEEYTESTAGGRPTRGATDALFVPDSTGVQVIVSSAGVTVEGVKIVLVDPGPGADGSGASQSSGVPTDVGDVSTTDRSTAPAPDRTAGPSADPSASSEPGPTGAPEPPGSTGPGATSPDELDPTGPRTPAQPGTPPGPAAPTATASPAAPTSPTGPADPAPTDSAPSDTGRGGAHLARPVSDLARATVARPAIMPRSSWGAPAPLCAVGYASAMQAAAIHHTASTNDYTAAQVPGLLRGFAAYQMRPEAQGGRGWCDIGYNFLVDKFGTVWEGRGGGVDMPVVGVHTGGFNSRVVGVAAIGNYQDAPPSAALAEGLSQIIAWKFAQHRILAGTSVTLVSGGGASMFPAGTAVTFSTVLGHRDAQLTACPGQHLYALFPDIRRRVAALSAQTVAESPSASWDLAATAFGAVRVAGWAADPDTSGPVTIQVSVDGVLTSVRADRPRTDVGAHGFDALVPAGTGERTVCLRVLNIGGGHDVHLGCRLVTSRSGNPVGSLDTVTASATGVSVTGWVRDPETSAPIDVHVYANALGTAWRADGPRPDVLATAPGEAGPRHGFAGTIGLPRGTYTVCAYGINIGVGVNALVGCKMVTVGAAAPPVVTPPVVAPPAVNRVPLGSLDVVRASGPSRVQVAGWAFDPDSAGSVQAHVYVDGRAVQAVTAAGWRPDVGAAYSRGAATGFDVSVPATEGRHEVCVYALDTAGGRNRQVGCRDVTVVNRVPVGSLDVVRASGPSRVQVAGWAFDPDSAGPVQVHVYVDGRAVQAVTAAGWRPDVGAAYSRGAATGFDVSVPAAVGQREVCVYALDTSGGRNLLVGCRGTAVR